MHNRWQLLVVMALALAAYGGDNNSGTELSAAQAVSTTTMTTIQPTTTTGPTPTTTTTTNPPGEREPAQPGSGSGETTPTGQEKTYKVVEGDTIWTIAEANMPGEPTNQEVAEYVDQVEKTNRDRLQSGDPDLIEPGETIILPPVAAPAEPTQEADRNTHDVAEGDNLWTIARDHLAKAPGGGSGEPTNQEVTEYWAKVVEANRDRLQSGDPDLIEPGEMIILPPVPSAPAEPAPETREQVSHVVVEGDNLWTIAGDHLAEARSGGAGELTTREVAAYWLRVIEANAGNLRSGDPDLIYPGETIVLPPVD
jgi:nucleoid-associated protein YgaU